MRLPDFHIHPDVWMVMVALWGAYLVSVTRRRRVAEPGEEPPSRRRTPLSGASKAAMPAPISNPATAMICFSRRD